jgi:hypothetical protein
VSDEALRDVYERIMRKRDVMDRADAVSVEAMQAVLERRGSEESRVRTLDAIMRDQDTRADFEILRPHTRRTRRTVIKGAVRHRRGGLSSLPVHRCGCKCERLPLTPCAGRQFR